MYKDLTASNWVTRKIFPIFGAYTDKQRDRETDTVDCIILFVHICRSSCQWMKDGSNYVPLHSMWFRSPPTCLWTGCTLQAHQGLVGPLELCVDVYVGWHVARTDLNITRLCKGNMLEYSQVKQLHTSITYRWLWSQPQSPRGDNSQQKGTWSATSNHCFQPTIYLYNIFITLYSNGQRVQDIALPVLLIVRVYWMGRADCLLHMLCVCNNHIWEWSSEKAVNYVWVSIHYQGIA